MNERVWRYWLNGIDRIFEYSEKTLPGAALPFTDPIWTILGLNSGVRNERQTDKHLDSDTASG
jgi:hypothetical protein